MRMPVFISTAILAAAVVAAGAFALAQHPVSATAASGTGTITGRVVWNSPLVVPYGATTPGAPGIAVPDQAVPEEDPESAPEALPDMAPNAGGGIARPGIPIRPIPRPRLIPAGAVLVAVQGTDLSARTDDQGRFRIDNVPAGQYLTVAAGPAAGVSAAIAIRPNAYVQEGRTVSLGTMYLGQSYSYGYPVPYPMAPGAAEGAAESGRARAVTRLTHVEVSAGCVARLRPRQPGRPLPSSQSLKKPLPWARMTGDREAHRVCPSFDCSSSADTSFS